MSTESANESAPGWNAARYLRFAAARQRPAVELLARVPERPFASILDLGCGPGNVTQLLAERWPTAAITGVDASPDMLAAARRTVPAARFVAADLNAWAPDDRHELIFSNAALHWLPDHPALFARLVSWLVPGGVLAVQMPDNFAAPSHQSIRELAAEPPYAEILGEARMGATLTPAAYHALLTAAGAQVDLWTVEYYQALSGDAPVLDWLRGTTLVPFLDRLGERREAFLAELALRLDAAYPRAVDGTVLFPFRRLFLVARC